ncbi:MAG: hypothetical protein ABSC94_20130 [Polyangiaceae bacterium]|jgi:hypothetical protein
MAFISIGRRPATGHAKRNVHGVSVLFLAAVLTVTVFLPTHGEPTVIEAAITSSGPPDHAAWIRVHNEEGITVWRALGTGAQAPAVRGETDIDAPLASVASFVFDLDRAPEWMAELEDVKTQTIGDTEWILYGHMRSIAFPIRAFTLTGTLRALSTPTALVAELRPALSSWAPDAMDRGGEPSSVLLRLAAAGGGRRTHLSVEIHCDPVTADAAWCGQQFQPDWVLSSLSVLRARIRTSPGAPVPWVLALLEKRPSPAGTRSGPSYESVLADQRDTITIGAPISAPDLTRAQLGAPLVDGSFLSDCNAPDDMKIEVRVAVRKGRAVGVTVATEPVSPAVASCVDRAVRDLRWPSSPKTDFLTTTYSI